MYCVKINEEVSKKFENSDCFYLGLGIIFAFNSETATICGLIDHFGIDNLLEDGKEYLKQISKSKKRKAISQLLCCGILTLEDGKLKFHKDKYIELNNIWMNAGELRFTQYKGFGTYEEVKKYEDMEKFVRKLF